MFPFLLREMFPIAHVQTHTHMHLDTHTQPALLSAGHVQEDGIPERREKVQLESRERERAVGGDGMENTAWSHCTL